MKMKDENSIDQDQYSEKEIAQLNRILEAKLKKESFLVREESMSVLKEFEELPDAPPL